MGLGSPFSLYYEQREPSHMHVVVRTHGTSPPQWAWRLMRTLPQMLACLRRASCSVGPNALAIIWRGAPSARMSRSSSRLWTACDRNLRGCGLRQCGLPLTQTCVTSICELAPCSPAATRIPCGANASTQLLLRTTSLLISVGCA